MPLPTFLRDVNASVEEPATIAVTKNMFVQALTALSMLQRAGVRHRDLTIRNMLVRVPSASARPHRHLGSLKKYRLVVIDFGGSHSVTLGQAPGVVPSDLGSRGRSDYFTVLCAFYDFYYRDRDLNCMAVKVETNFTAISSPDPQAFDNLLARELTEEHRQHNFYRHDPGV